MRDTDITSVIGGDLEILVHDQLQLLKVFTRGVGKGQEGVYPIIFRVYN